MKSKSLSVFFLAILFIFSLITSATAQKLSDEEKRDQLCKNEPAARTAIRTVPKLEQQADALLEQWRKSKDDSVRKNYQHTLNEIDKLLDELDKLDQDNLFKPGYVRKGLYFCD